MIKNLFPLFVILSMLSGCFTLPRPTSGTMTYGHLSQVSPESNKEPEQSTEEKEEPKAKPKTTTNGVVSPTVGALLGIGAMSMTLGLGATMYDDGGDEGAMYFAVGSLGVGLVFWGAAGIVALTED